MPIADLSGLFDGSLFTAFGCGFLHTNRLIAGRARTPNTPDQSSLTGDTFQGDLAITCRTAGVVKTTNGSNQPGVDHVKECKP